MKLDRTFKFSICIYFYLLLKMSYKFMGCTQNIFLGQITLNAFILN